MSRPSTNWRPPSAQHGLIQPLIVSETADGSYELIAGERRLRAARRAGMSEVPVIVKDVTPQQVLEIALVENVQRADLNPLEEGLALPDPQRRVRVDPMTRSPGGWARAA
jgi:ParB/RepB/Spo0J family partition protein